MTFIFPECLAPLRGYLSARGCDVSSIASPRQAGFLAQKLLGSRVKFPIRGQDMLPTLLEIQKVVPLPKNAAAPAPAADLFGKPTVAKAPPKPKTQQKPPAPYLTAFTPEIVARGLHVFADGACDPNPGPGGWAFVAYKDGQEIASGYGGDLQATNNTMELTALLRAIEWGSQGETEPAIVWCDSQYAVKGANTWMAGWKSKGWRRATDKASTKNQAVANVELWKAIDAALSDPRAANIKIAWVRGHAGHAGNERADELAEIGRRQALEEAAAAAE